MPSNMQATYDDIKTRDEDWVHFFKSQIWKDIKYMLAEDMEWGMEKLLGDTINDPHELNRLRGKIDAYREMIRLDENISAIISGEDELIIGDEEDIEDAI